MNILGPAISSAVSARMAKKQMAFQERMANTRYQRTMADMKKAGLSPILAYKQGGGPAPSGAMGKPPDISVDGVNTALAIRKQRQEVRNLEATERLTEAQTETAHNTARSVEIDNKIKAPQVPVAELTEEAKEKGVGLLRRGTNAVIDFFGLDDDLRVQENSGKKVRELDKEPASQLIPAKKRYPYTFQQARESRERREQMERLRKRVRRRKGFGRD